MVAVGWSLSTYVSRDGLSTVHGALEFDIGVDIGAAYVDNTAVKRVIREASVAASPRLGHKQNRVERVWK